VARAKLLSEPEDITGTADLKFDDLRSEVDQVHHSTSAMKGIYLVIAVHVPVAATTPACRSRANALPNTGYTLTPSSEKSLSRLPNGNRR
jgi:hypothetical protein